MEFHLILPHSSHPTPTLTYKNTHHQNQRKVPSTRATEELGLGTGAKAERGGRERAQCTLFCTSAQAAQSPGRLSSLPAGPETGSCYWSAGRGLQGRGVGAGRRQPPRAPRATTSSPTSGCGRGLKELEKEPGEGEKRSSISSSSSSPRKRSPAAIPADCLTPERSTHPSRPTVLDASPRASPKPSGAGGSTPVGDSDRCRGGPGSYGARLASTTVSRGREHGVSPSPQRGRWSYSHHWGSTSGSRAGSAPPVLSLNHSPALGGPQISHPELPSTSLARLASSSTSSLGTRSPGRPAPRLPWQPVPWAWLFAFFGLARGSGWWPSGRVPSACSVNSNF